MNEYKSKNKRPHVEEEENENNQQKKQRTKSPGPAVASSSKLSSTASASSPDHKRLKKLRNRFACDHEFDLPWVSIIDYHYYFNVFTSSS